MSTPDNIAIVVATVKLDVTPDDHVALTDTLTTMNRATQYVADEAFQGRVWSKLGLQRRCYYDVRSRFGLGAQAAQHAIRKAANSYTDKTRRDRRQVVKVAGGVSFDDRNLAWNLDSDHVRIWTTAGRLQIRIRLGAHQRKLLASRAGESVLMRRDGNWYLTAACRVGKPDYCEDVVGWMGVDLGVKNIAAWDRTQWSSGRVNGHRRRQEKLRARLQSKNTKSSKRLIKKRSRRERRMAADVNHQISKQVVREAQRAGRGIALENLGGIRDRVTVRKPQRRRHHSWSFAQLRGFIEYKATLAGVPVVVVDPRNTSRTCPHCTYVSKKNRPTRDRFVCQACGFVDHADLVAAANIGRRGASMRPHAGDYGFIPDGTCKPRSQE